MLSKIKYKPIYRTHKDSIQNDFYIPSFSESVELDRAVGFFSLHSLALSMDGLIRFTRNNGQIRLICSPELSHTDAELIDSCLSIDEEYVTKSLIDTITESKLSEEEISQLDIICNMISVGKLKIKIAFRPLGLFHEKFGIFVDSAGNKVYFNGSLNETKSALVYNQESIRVNCSWDSFQTKEFVNHEHEYFNNLWNNQEDSVIVLGFPEAVKEKLLTYYKRSSTLESAIDSYIKKLLKPGKKTLYSYQEEAIKQFCDNGYRHFYEMATGTGKTYTSVKTIQTLKHKCEEKRFIVVCVPQIDLQVQWANALQEEGYERIYLLGGVGNSFDRTMSDAIIDFELEDEDVICVAVYDTFFSKVYSNLTAISSLFIIVDEAHNLTKGQLSILKRLDPKYRLGLSATIQRHCESESKAIIEFFTPGVTFYYGIEDAINSKFLSEYEYYPICVHLTEDENNKFLKKSKLLAQELSKDDPDEEVIDKLRRERSLILKQASNKIIKLRELVDGGYNFVNSVVYCGQGKDAEGDSIIDTVTKILYDGKLVVSQFTSNTQDRKKVLFEFEHGYFDTLVAIRCFDEGVDVPKLDKIYIMASDGALRQTVQRRGRVLRKCKESGKTIAYIYDMIVLPALENGTYGCEGLLKIELSRGREYNRLALNKEDNERLFSEIENNYHITIDNVVDYETEPD